MVEDQQSFHLHQDGVRERQIHAGCPGHPIEEGGHLITQVTGQPADEARPAFRVALRDHRGQGLPPDSEGMDPAQIIDASTLRPDLLHSIPIHPIDPVRHQADERISGQVSAALYTFKQE